MRKAMRISTVMQVLAVAFVVWFAWAAMAAPVDQPPPSPLSQGKPVTVSSQYTEPGYEPARAVDGDSKTRWASDIAARSCWLEVDLGAEVSAP